MAKAVDLELRKAFVQLQAKMVESSQKIQLIEAQMQGLNRVRMHVEITQQEINSLKPTTRTYESVGRMFILTDLPEVKTNLKARQAVAQKKISELESSKTYLERSLKESEDNLREMVQLRKDQPA